MLVQIIPIQQIGKALSQNQWTEEETPHGDCTSSKGAFHLLHPFLPPCGYSEINQYHTNNEMTVCINVSEEIPHNHSAEVIILPPDSLQA